MKVPADCYTWSSRLYRGLEELTYPFHDATVTVTRCGPICWQRRKINLSHAFAAQNVGVTQVGDHVWLVCMCCDLAIGVFSSLRTRKDSACCVTRSDHCLASVDCAT